MASDSSDDEQFETADDSESEELHQMSFHNELSSSSESSDDMSGHESIRGIFKFGKLSSSKVSGKENEEFQDENANEETASVGDENVNLQTSELPSDQSEEIGLHSSVTDNAAEVVGRNSTDSTKDLKEQATDSINIIDDSDMNADENIDIAETVEEKETLIDNMNSSHLSPSHMRGIEGNADESFQQEMNDTDKTYQTEKSLSISDSFVILDSEPTSTLLLVDNEQTGEIEKSFQNATQIPSSEGMEQSFEICDESFGESVSIYENIENTMVNPSNSNDTKMTSPSIAGNSAKDSFLHLSQPSSAEGHEKSVRKQPPPVAPKPRISKQKQELNGGRIQSILIMEDEALNKTDDKQSPMEAEQKQMIEQSLEINSSAPELSQLDVDMVDIVNDEKEEIDDAKEISKGHIQASDFEEEIADAEERHQKETKTDATQHDSNYNKQKGDSCQQPLLQVENIEPHMYTFVEYAQETHQRDMNVDDVEQLLQDNMKSSFQDDDTEERPLKDKQMEKAHRGQIYDTQIEIYEENHQDNTDNAEERPQRDIPVEDIKVSDMIALFESTPVKNTANKNTEGDLYNIKSFQDQNEPVTPRVSKRLGNIVLKSHKQPSAEPRSLNQSNSEQSHMEQSDMQELPCETQMDDNIEKPENPVDEDNKDLGPPTPPPKSITVMESLKNIIQPPPPPLPPKSLTVMKTHNIDPQVNVTSEPSVVHPPPLPPKRSSDQSANVNPQNMPSSLPGQIHDQDQSQQDRSSLQTSQLLQDMPGAESNKLHLTQKGSEGGMQMPSMSHGQPNWSTGDSGNSTRQPEYHVPPLYGPCGPPPMPGGSQGPQAQYWPPWGAFYPGYGHQFPPGMQPGHFPNMHLYRPPFIPSHQSLIRHPSMTNENPDQHIQQEYKQQQQMQQQQKQQQQQPRLLVSEDEASGQSKHAEPKRKQEERQKEENKNINKEKDEPHNVKPSQLSKTSGVSQISPKGKKVEDAASKRDKEKKNATKITDQDSARSSPQHAKRKEDHKQGTAIKDSHTASEEIASKPGYTMVIGLNESTSDDNLWNFMEAKSGTDLKEIVYGPERKNAVVIFERKPDLENLKEKISKRPLDDKLLEVFDIPPPVSIVVSTKDPKEFSNDTLTYHFESPKYGGAELVEDGIKKTEDGCYILTFTDCDAVERVCAIQHKVENVPLIVSPYYQFKKWTAWNTAIHGINIPEPFAHTVDILLLRYLQSFPRAVKEMQMAMEEMHAGIELQKDAVLVTCLITREVKDCRKLVTSWKKDAEEKCDKFLSCTFRIEKITITLNIWEDLINIVKSMIKDKEIILIEEKTQCYIQLIGFCDEVTKGHDEVNEEKKKLERIRSIGKDKMSLKSASKKRLLDRAGIFQQLKTQFSDFDVCYEPSSEEIVLTGVPEDRNNAKLQIFEELKKFDDPVVIADSTAHFTQFIKEGAPRNCIIERMETKSLIVDWDVNIKNSHVSVYCIPAHSTHHAASQIKNMVKETSIPLSQAEQLFATTEEWSMYQAETQSKCQGLVHIVVTNDLTNIICISMEDLHADILEKIKDFIKKNTVIKEMIQCNPVTKKFVQAFWGKGDFKEIEENTGDKHLQLNWQGEKLMMEGTAEGIQKAKELWKEKTSKIIFKSETLKRIGVKEVLMSEEQRGILKSLEKKHRCLIQTEDTDSPSSQEISGDTNLDEEDRVYGTRNEKESLETQRSGPYRCQNGLTVSLVKGQLAEQKVDVIVCATSPDLNLNAGAASKSLLQRGGQSLQTECKSKYPDKIQEGEVVGIDGGELQCAKVYLTALPDWRKSNDGQALRDVVVKCLEKAQKDSKTSIAFAAMGTGQIRYPHDDVARLMYEACIMYDRENPKSSVKKVHFVLYEKDNVSIRAFEKEEENMLCGRPRPQSSVPSPQEYTVGNVKISQTVDELTNQQVDAILCSCAENMILSKSGACAALLKAGGQTLQDECTTKYPNGIKHGDIAIIGGGNLKCKHVLLTALPKFADNGEKVLSDVIQSALQIAAGKGCKSIAMSAMGTGYLRYPANLVAKVMHDAVRDWAKKNSSSSLTTVKFVLFSKDKSTWTVFQDHLRGTNPRASTRKQRTISAHDVKTLSGTGSCIVVDPNDDSACTVGKMKVKVYIGDIINETTDAIVNSVGSDFSLQGGVAALLKQKCPGLEKVCQDKVGELRRSGVVMTDSFGLKCKKIIHVEFQDKLMGWKRVMKKCLEKANKRKLSSISFPVLGTGGGVTSFDAEKIAEMLFEALIDFDDGNKDGKRNLQQVNVVVYNKQPEFIPAIKKGMVKVSYKGPRGAIGRTLDRVKDVGREVKDMFLPRSGHVKHQRTPTISRSQMSQITIQFYSDSEPNIQQCIADLDIELNKLYISTPLNDDLIAKMSQQEFEEFFKTDLLVECEFIKEEKQVLIRGTPQNVSKAQNKFQTKLRDKFRKDKEKEEAEQLYQIVQWHYEEVTAEEIKLTPYEKLINLKIEKAFKNDDHLLELPDTSSNTVYIIDFKNYFEYVRDDVEDKVKIVRKDILQAKAGALPENWAEMQDKENLKRVNVLNPSPEYQQVENIFLQEAKTGPYSNRVPNVQNIKVIKIERIQNKTLYQQYLAKKKSMEAKYKDKSNVTIERKVWHGTSPDVIDSICIHGFNRSYCGKHGVWYGQGVYFATNASYSARGWLAAGNQTPAPGAKQCIFFVSVCVGEYVLGTKDMRFLPAKNPSNPTDIYDCAVNDVKNVEEIVIFNDTQAYPDYLITFTS